MSFILYTLNLLCMAFLHLTLLQIGLLACLVLSPLLQCMFHIIRETWLVWIFSASYFFFCRCLITICCKSEQMTEQIREMCFSFPKLRDMGSPFLACPLVPCNWKYEIDRTHQLVRRIEVAWHIDHFPSFPFRCLYQSRSCLWVDQRASTLSGCSRRWVTPKPVWSSWANSRLWNCSV